MPGDISSSYDPEFGTGANADAVRAAVEDLRRRVTAAIGSDELHDIVKLARAKTGGHTATIVTDERDLRILRFALNRALDSL